MTISGEPQIDRDQYKKSYMHTQVEQQLQTIQNLFNSGIPPETIADQVDVDKDEVSRIIQDIIEQEERKRNLLEEHVSNNPSLGSIFYLDAVVDIEKAIKSAETRIWKALKSEPEFTLSTEETKGILKKLARSKVPMVILHVDLVGSTRLSMSVPLDRLTTIMQAFTQEMSVIVNMYGGYILKYVGDAVIAFFVPGGSLNPDIGYNKTGTKDGFEDRFKDPHENSSPSDSIEMGEDKYFLSCINAIDCGRLMVRIIQQGINPILNQFDYPELGVRIGIDLGENAIIQYGFDIHKCDDDKLVKEPHYDILGHTINMAVKMTSFASVNRIVIGQSVYKRLTREQRSKFKLLKVRPTSWTYVDEGSGKMYSLFTDTSSLK